MPRSFEWPLARGVPFGEGEVNPDALFEKLPDVLSSGFREQMLLGLVPAETVQQILEPLLSNFYQIMPKLSPELQADFENVLRIYPEVAQRFGVWVKPNTYPARARKPVGKGAVGNKLKD